MRIYTASSWRNHYYTDVVNKILAAGHEVYDFRNPPNGSAFNWNQIDPDWTNDIEGAEPEKIQSLLEHPLASKGFREDFGGMRWAEIAVLVLPCNRSAHMEAGWFVGQGKPLLILCLEPQRPELTYRLARNICTSITELLDSIRLIAKVQEAEAK